MLQNHTRRLTVDRRREVLIAEDEYVNREILREILENDYVLHFAENGQVALEALQAHKGSISLVLLDLLMPVMGGLDVLRQMKDDPELSHIPVIVLTSDQDAEVESLTLGAVDFIPKPYPQASVVLARVQRIIQLFEDAQIISSTERDPLTGLYTREYFYRYAEQLDQRNPDVPMDALIIDVNRFHMINERFGMVFGDALLKRLGEALLDLVHNIGGIVCRRSADMFMVYCPHGEDYNNLLESVSVDISGEGLEGGRLRLRMGVYAGVDKSVGVEQRFDRAKLASDTVQGSFTKRVGMYDDTMHEREIYSEQLIEDFGRAIAERQFQVYYQPKFDVRPSTPVLGSGEALVRWLHPDLGMISPGDFIPLFEENGLIQQLDRYVWREAAAQIADWKARLGFSVPISVNVSRIDMHDPQLIESLKQVLVDAGVSTGDLLLEITESAYTQDSDRIIETVKELRRLGFRVEMDDFGTGYSSLNMISTLPIDALKLDMQFVRSAFSRHRDTRIIEIIIDIADYLGVPVIAEGVETEEQMVALRAMGCDYVQGYYFSRPVSAGDFEEFLLKRKELLAEAPLAGESAFMRRARRAVGSGAGGAGDESAASAGSSATVDGAGGGVSADAGASGELGVSGSQGVDYASIARALATDYFNIYYVDTETGQFIEYGGEESGDIDAERTGEDFFTLIRRDVAQNAHPDDVEMFLSAFTKRNVLAAIEHDRAFTLTYRVMFGSEETYVNMKATRMGARDDERFVVIGVSNVDEQMRREREYARALRAAHQDPLTGVKSAHAYADEERKVDHAIRTGAQEPFAVAVCDVNDLKRINETRGQTEGDQCLRDACTVICNVFKHSPVFRVGGDEFAVILRGKDYESRASLMAMLDDSNEASKRHDGVLVAGGIAAFKPGRDAVLSAVYERAEYAMRQSKARLKQG